MRLVRLEPGWLARVHFLLYKMIVAVLRAALGRGAGRAAWALERLFGSSHLAVFSPFSDRLLSVPLGDGYWMPVLTAGRDYEPEVHFILSRALNPECAFLDCGANIGWWSLFASTIISSPKRIVAIEASPDLHARLTQTAGLNGKAFTCLNRAIWNVTGERVRVLADKRNHARSSVTALDEGNWEADTVLSITLDDVAKDLANDSIREVVVKLDVEGAEIRALEGGKALLERNCLVVYEDHGSDRTCQVTGHVLKAGFRVFYCDDALQVIEIIDVARFLPLKRDPRRGYNLVACRPGTPFHRVMLRLVR